MTTTIANLATVHRKDEDRYLASRAAYHEAIRKAHDEGRSIRDIAKEAGISKTMVHRIVRREG